MTPTVIADLKAHRRRQLEGQLLAGDRWHWNEWDLVFPTSLGTPYHHVNMLHRFKTLLKRAGREERRYHDLRHSCGSFWIVISVHPQVVMYHLGHAHISMSMNIDAKVEISSIKATTDAMDDLFGVKTSPPEISRLNRRLV
ncbi:MAG: tyrosine-type recombinase/integrase [Thermomicrobiales bacterium]